MSHAGDVGIERQVGVGVEMRVGVRTEKAVRVRGGGFGAFVCVFCP